MRRYQKCRRLCVSIAIMLCMVLGFPGEAMVTKAATTTYYPVESNEILTNPYMGWVPAATVTNHVQPHTMVYASLLWSELEPDAKGGYDWAGFEARNNFDYWRSKGVKINIRFYMDLPTTTSHMDIPQWLYNAMGSTKGTYYDCSIGKGFSPDYTDPVLISEHERVIAAIAERYNNDTDIAFIQIGSLGHWGEWHCWPYNSSDGGPSGVFPAESISNQYVTHYLQSFSSGKLCMRRSTQLAANNGMGLFNDMFGETASTEASGWGWLWQINNGYLDDLGQTQPAMPDFWKYGPSGGEFGNGNSALYLTNEKIDETIRLAQVSHTSWLGPCCPADLEVNGTYQENIDRLLKTIGYRFVLESVSHATTAAAGSTMNVTMNWSNKGVAPFYFQWPLRLGLADANGVITYTTATEDIRNWLPGTTTVNADLIVPSTVQSGTYTLVVALIDPATNQPGINLAIGGKRADGWYALDTITVSGTSSAQTVNITVDGNASDWSSVPPVVTAGGQTATSLKVYDDADYVYICVEGAGLGGNAELFIDRDSSASTGYLDGIWQAAGMDYMIEAGRLYSHPANSSDWTWTDLGTGGVSVSSNTSVYEARIAKTAISGSGSAIGVGFKDINSSWSLVCSLPGTGGCVYYSFQ